MKKRRVWRYTCEHCKKSNCSSSAMALHELRCFKNPTRKCPVCEVTWPSSGIAVAMQAMSEIDQSTEKSLMSDLADACESCPACIMSAIYQAPLPMVDPDVSGYRDLEGVWHDGNPQPEYRYRIDWDYKKARDEYRAEQRAEESALVWPPAF